MNRANHNYFVCIMSSICFWKASYEYDNLCMTQINDNSVSMYCVYCKVLLYTCWSYLFHRLVVRGKSPLMLLPLFCKESRSRGFGQQALDQSHTHFLTHYFALFYPIHKEVLLSGEEIIFELKRINPSLRYVQIGPTKTAPLLNKSYWNEGTLNRDKIP